MVSIAIYWEKSGSSYNEFTKGHIRRYSVKETENVFFIMLVVFFYFYCTAPALELVKICHVHEWL